MVLLKLDNTEHIYGFGNVTNSSYTSKARQLRIIV